MRGRSRAATTTSQDLNAANRLQDLSAHAPSAQSEDENGDSKITNGPPSKRRKLDDSTIRQRSSSRFLSPPWKRIAVDGPPSFVEGGRRKSSRTNAIPMELQPPSGKRQTRATIQNKQYKYVTKSRYGGATFTPSSKHTSTQSAPTNASQRPQSAGKHSTPQIAKKSPTKGAMTKDAPAKASATKTSSQKPHYGKPVAKTPRTPTRSTANALRKPPGRKPRRSLRAQENAAARREQEYLEVNGRVSDSDSDEPVDFDPNVKTPRLKFRVKMPKVPIAAPKHVLPPKKYSTFEECMANDNPLQGEDVKRMTEEDAKREARLRLRILEASRPGNPLSEEQCSVYVPDPQVEPDQQYAHHDHLVAQAIHFRKLMNQERRNHIIAARKVAQAAAAEWKRRQPKTEEEVEAEQREGILARYKQLRRDLQTKWDMVAIEVNKRRLVQWEEEQQFLGKQALNEMLEHSTQLLDARRLRRPSDPLTDEEDDGQSSIGTDSGSGEDDESNMSSSESDRENQEELEARSSGDEDLTIEELRHKYSLLPKFDEDEDGDLQSMDADQSETRSSKSPPEPSTPPPEDEYDEMELEHTKAPPVGVNTAETEDVDDALLDESDESIDMDDDMGDSDDDSSSEEEEEDEDEDEDEDTEANLLGFISKSELEADIPSKDPTAETDIIKDEDSEQIQEATSGSVLPQNREPSMKTAPRNDVKEQESLPTGQDRTPELDHISGEPSSQASPGTNATTKPSEIDSASSIELHADSQHPSSATTPQSLYQLKTPVPFLLRGTLREYQHYGLDWLAGLYANGTNGILADEMGLGKTIQTIALFAHLACVHEVWGPHLIVVPTSVMLNWEMEFKKWCPGFKILTYYGTQEERKQKRKGWLNDNLWNVCITSYQLVLQDQTAFKRRNWHYMVLDEAHNIKNFRSQRWQILLNFKTRARLLLTGTPLQNNLTELWSLLFFLMPSDGPEKGIGGFADLQEFSDWFKRPVEQILEHGRDTMDDEAKMVVAKLHRVLRPYLLRRLKADVEKQMPAKHEHVVYCRLSKRQRYLYDGFMALGQTRDTLASGNYLSIINCLMQLRKVCNHPDLFETRQIVTSFAMPKAAVADFEIKELLVRKRLLQEDPMTRANLDFLNLTPTTREHTSFLAAKESSRIIGLPRIQDLCHRQLARINWRQEFDPSTTQSALDYMMNAAKIARNEELRHAVYLSALRSQSRPLYGSGLIDSLTINAGPRSLRPPPKVASKRLDWVLNKSDHIRAMVPTLSERSQMMEPFVQKFGCITPSVTATDLTSLTLTQQGMDAVREAQQISKTDAFHEARIRMSIAFPDKRLLQYDCGKLQRLDKLLRDLQAGGHRALIFTQMTKVLDILEQFLNIHGHRYLRLDGNTKVEQRQVLTERFNSDTRILAFILSSRSGGLGINLTGADTVIFYDLDWNPAMDKQCQDRCHRIGQTRDVHIYRFVSEYTIEANILRKANQKRMLDDVVIQEGEFTTDYFNKLSIRDMLGDDASAALEKGDASASAAMDRVLGASEGEGGVGKVLEQVEDIEDTEAARLAEKEITSADNADFVEERGTADSSGAAPTPKDSTTCGTPRVSSMPPPPTSARSGASKAQVTPAAPNLETSMTLGAAESGLAPPSGREAGTHHEEDAIIVDAPEEAYDEPGHVDEYMLRFIEWELKDVPVTSAVERNRARAKAKKAHHIKRAAK
ncbi:MAG: swr1 complex component [Sclerophora amabilis]|nr:MAG: swr1 complex component [Sclerophora amabilis]